MSRRAVRRETRSITMLVAAMSMTCAAVTSAAPPSPGPSASPAWAPPPVHAGVDYQIGGDYPLPEGVTVVSRDWFAGTAPDDAYTICYVNAFQTQDDEADVERPDERSAWPRELVLVELGDDPSWGGEYLIDISTPEKRAAAAAWMEPIIATCAAKGFEAVEPDNLDSWTRFDDTPMEDRVPFDEADAVAYAELIADIAHRHGLAVAQKNTVELPADVARDRIGFDFAVAEECGRWDECQGYVDVYGDHVIVIEYRRRDLERTCRDFGDRLSVVLRDVNVTTPGSETYRYATCRIEPSPST
ncbi:MAG: endo alpha-1,4 polygalactosaminidase [Candidatus Limnocylindrales bacterium]